MLIFACSACDAAGRGDLRGPDSVPIPVITGLSVNEASVGDEVRFLGSGFAPAQEGWTDVHFVGRFIPNDGSTPNDVNLTIPLQERTDGALIWKSFGGYRVPFLPGGHKLGRFEGEIYAENQFFPGSKFFDEQEDGSVLQEEDRLTTTFYVLPSLVVLDNRAFGDDFVADCKEPATNLLEMMQYALRVRALGFMPARYDFTMGEGLLQVDEENKLWIMNQEDRHFSFPAGGNEEFAVTHRWSPTPREANGYESSVVARATGVWTSKSVVFPIVIRPWAYVEFDRAAVVAETMTPDPVSSCIPGGPNSVEVLYSERETETLQRGVSSTLRRGFEKTLQESHEESYEFSQTETFSETESVTVASGRTETEEGTVDETKIFSDSASKRRADRLAWEGEQGGRYAGLVELTGEINSQDQDIRTGSLTGSIVPPGLKVEDLFGHRFGPIVVVGSRRSENIYVIDTFDDEDMAAAINANRNIGTEGYNLQEGRSWGFTQNYETQVGFAAERSRSERESFGQAITFSEEVRRARGTTESEVLTQSSSESTTRDSKGFVWAGLQGMWFRQATRILHPGVMVALDLCGNGTAVGDIDVSEWVWAVDLGLDEQCPPPTNFLPAGCRRKPCVH